MKLNHKQTQALDYLEDQVTNELLFGGGAGGGKSILGCYWLAKMAAKFPGTRWLMAREELTTLKDTTLKTFWKVCKMQGLKAGVHYRYIDNPKNIIIFRNGSEILLRDLKLKPSDPEFDDLGSLEITGAFIDEANQCCLKAKSIVFSRIRHALDENGLIPKLLMTCNPAKNWVYTEFYRLNKDGKLPAHRKFIQALVTDNPDISKHYRSNLLTLDKASKERLLYGNWEYDDDPATLMDYNKIIDVFSNTHVAEGDKKITVDLARFGGDKIVFVLWNGFRGRIRWFKKQGIDITIEQMEKFREELGIGRSDILVDEDGLGGGVVDMYKGCRGFVNGSSPIQIGKKKVNYVNLKSQCYFNMADRVNKAGYYLDIDDPETKQFIIEEMEQVKKKDVDKDGKNAIVSKDKVKEILGRSPDFSDAIMMREWFELKPKVIFSAA